MHDLCFHRCCSPLLRGCLSFAPRARHSLSLSPLSLSPVRSIPFATLRARVLSAFGSVCFDSNRRPAIVSFRTLHRTFPLCSNVTNLCLDRKSKAFCFCASSILRSFCICELALRSDRKNRKIQIVLEYRTHKRPRRIISMQFLCVCGCPD